MNSKPLVGPAPSTTIEYKLPEESDVSLKVYNTLGQEVKTLVDKVEGTGDYNINFNANNLASGVYIYRFEAKSETGNKVYFNIEKMALFK